SASTCVLNNGDTARFVSDGTHWVLVGGSAALRLSLGDFGSSLAANGYQKLPNSFIVQWGAVVTSNSGVGNVAFPIAFPNQQLGAVATINAVMTTGLVSTYNYSKTGMSVGTRDYQAGSGVTAAVTYFAWGF
ncbi:gp53-like domain-containing protein, partial [Burkholderia ubonensis]